MESTTPRGGHDDGSPMLSLVDSALDATAVDWEAATKTLGPSEERGTILALRDLATIVRAQRRLSSGVIGRWGHLELRERLGQGAFGEVFRARDTRLDREVALKLYRLRAGAGLEKRNLLKEGQRHSRVHDRNVVKIFGAGEHNGRVGISMELVEGMSLKELMALDGFGPLSAAEASYIGRQLCRALTAVHNQKLIHGDVKASNVMRRVGGDIVLMDFSASRPLQPDLLGDEEISGTPVYMAPEVLLGERPTPQSDLYSVGVLLFYLVTGLYPVFGRSIDDLREIHRTGTRASLSDLRSDLPDNFVRAVNHALEIRPMDRVESAGSLEEALGGSGENLKAQAQLSAAIAATTRALGEAADSVVISIRLLANASLLAACLLAFLGIQGFLTTMTYNVVLGLDEHGFSPPVTFVNSVYWGIRALVLPASTALLVALTYLVVKLLSSLLVPESFGAELRERLRRRAGRLASPKMQAQLSIVGSFLAFAVVFVLFRDLIEALEGIAGTEPRRSGGFGILSPRYEDAHFNYYWAFTGLTVFVGWWMVKVLRRLEARSTLSRVVATGMSTVILLSTALVAIPYRVLEHNDSPRFSFRGDTAYAVGQRDDEVLLFIPRGAELPERLVVASDHPDLVRDPDGISENVFTELE